MTNLLRRDQAPLTEQAWQEVDSLARRIMKSQLSARRFVDVDGPHGWDLAAVDTGHLQLGDQKTTEDVPWGVRTALPLLEVRLPFVLSQMELDAISRGCKDPDLDSLQHAVQKAVRFEESVIYDGLPAAQVQGILPAQEQDSVALPEDPRQYPEAVARALQSLESAAMSEPYVVVLGRTPYFKLWQQGTNGYPPHRLIKDMTKGVTCSSPAIAGGVVLSAAPGNFELTIGQDWSIGYAIHNRDDVELYLTQSFTFRVLEPAAVVELTVAT